MSEAFEGDVEKATSLLQEAVSSPARAEDAIVAAFAQIFSTAALDGKGKGLDADQRAVLDAAARAVLARMVADAVAVGTPVMTWQQQPQAPPAVPRLLDMFLLTSEQKFMDPGLVFALLEDLVETITISECEGVFTYLEANATAVGRPRAKQMGKHHMLRTCNQLLRRLSKGHNAVLCGRILIFLARLLPLSDRSGINLQGAYNTSNITPIEDVPEGALDSNGEPIDAEFYRRFWGLQAAFRSPGTHMAPSPWAAAVLDLQAVLTEFQKQKIVAAASAAPDPNSAELPAVKYLSSPKLMRLQLQDAAFRRHFLIQALVYLHACRHPGRMEKETLRSKQLDTAAELEEALYRQLEATPEKGAEFAAAIRVVLSDETRWSAWKKEPKGAKNETCQPFERPPYVPPAPAAAQPTGPLRKRQRVDPAGAPPRIRLGSAALDQLWNQVPNNMAGLKVEERKHLPTLREFLDPVVEDMDPENCIEEEYRRKHDKVYQWKALRMISRESLPIFAKTALANDLEEAARGFFPTEVPAKEPEKPAVPPQTSTAEPTKGLSVSDANEGAAVAEAGGKVGGAAPAANGSSRAADNAAEPADTDGTAAAVIADGAADAGGDVEMRAAAADEATESPQK